MENLWNRLINSITSGHERSVRAKKNIIVSLFFRGGTILINLLLVPVLLHYLDAARYGIWLTIISILAWFGFMDLGIGDGLRNKFAESKAGNYVHLAREYVSTTYALLALIMGAFLIIILSVTNVIPWTSILNVPGGINDNIGLLVIILFSFLAVEIVDELIITVLISDQKPAIQHIVDFFSRFFFLGAVWILSYLYPPSLVYVALSYTIPTLLILTIVSVWFYTGEYRQFRPSVKFIRWGHYKDLLGLGVKFFIIQIGVLVLISTDNIIITQLYGPAQVTVYQIVGKYFTVIQMVFMVIVTPFWSATTEAYIKKDYAWIISVKKKYLTLFWFGCLALAVFLVLAPYAYRIWVGANFHASFSLSLVWVLFVVVQIYTAIYFFIVNGVGNIQLQLYAYLVVIVINIPLSIFFAKGLGMGITGVVLASTLCHALHLFYLPKQVNKIVTGRLNGIWAK